MRPQSQKGENMSVAKVIEISTGSPESFEAAIREGIRRAAGTVEDIKGAWVKEQQVVVENGEVKEFRVDMKVTFVLKE
jgi:flavin-binding protein dodecin